MKRLFVLLLLLAGAIQAEALTKDLTWDPVTKNVDGTPAVVDSYNFYRSVDGGATFVAYGSVSGSETTAQDPNVVSGHICYYLTASNAQGESAPSNRVCLPVPTARPEAPLNLR